MSPVNALFPGSYAFLSIMMKDFEKAEGLVKRDEELNPNSDWLNRNKALLLAAKGDREGALALNQHPYIYSALGLIDEAIDEIKERIENGSRMPYLILKHQPIYKILQENPRFQDILKQQKGKYEELLRVFADL